MMSKLFSFLLLVAVATAFSPIAPTRFGVIHRAPTPLSMFSGDEPKGLQEVQDTKNTVLEASTKEGGEEKKEAPKAVYRNLARGGESVEVPWVDEAMRANTNPLEMSWWAYILFGLPMVLLANDFLHFLPKEGPLSILTTL